MDGELQRLAARFAAAPDDAELGWALHHAQRRLGQEAEAYDTYLALTRAGDPQAIALWAAQRPFDAPTVLPGEIGAFTGERRRWELSSWRADSLALFGGEERRLLVNHLGGAEGDASLIDLDEPRAQPVDATFAGIFGPRSLHSSFEVDDPWELRDADGAVLREGRFEGPILTSRDGLALTSLAGEGDDEAPRLVLVDLRSPSGGVLWERPWEDDIAAFIGLTAAELLLLRTSAEGEVSLETWRAGTGEPIARIPLTTGIPSPQALWLGRTHSRGRGDAWLLDARSDPNVGTWLTLRQAEVGLTRWPTRGQDPLPDVCWADGVLLIVEQLKERRRRLVCCEPAPVASARLEPKAPRWTIERPNIAGITAAGTRAFVAVGDGRGSVSSRLERIEVIDIPSGALLETLRPPPLLSALRSPSARLRLATCPQGLLLLGEERHGDHRRVALHLIEADASSG